MNESRAILLAFAAGILLAPTTAQGNEIQFNRDIRPILTENCYHCHGPDPGSRKEGLRLDRVEGLLEKRDTGMPVVPGNPDKSTLIERVFTDDRDEVMPPPESKKKLSPRGSCKNPLQHPENASPSLKARPLPPRNGGFCKSLCFDTIYRFSQRHPLGRNTLGQSFHITTILEYPRLPSK